MGLGRLVALHPRRARALSGPLLIWGLWETICLVSNQIEYGTLFVQTHTQAMLKEEGEAAVPPLCQVHHRPHTIAMIRRPRIGLDRSLSPYVNLYIQVADPTDTVNCGIGNTRMAVYDAGGNAVEVRIRVGV